MVEDGVSFLSETKTFYEEPVLSVSALLARLQNTLSADFSEIHVLGEVHAFHSAASGHWYIDLKDEKKEALVQLCFFRYARRANSYEPKIGDLVEVRGRLQLYEPQGRLSLVVTSLKPAGEGLLYAKFIALKMRLEADGFFDASRKKPIPLYPKRVGVITSETGAAIRDVVKTISLHAPNIALTLYPTPVQGEGAEKEIIKALKLADKLHEVDCLLLVRGGGSLSDLWTFNTEEVARAIANTKLPIICGVGHETDTTIADFVADLRAATPTAAAMAVASGWEKGALEFKGFLRRLTLSKDAKLRELQAKLRLCSEPQRLMKPLLEHFKIEYEKAYQKLLRSEDDVFEEKKAQLSILFTRLQSLKPSSGIAQERFIQLVTRFRRASTKLLEERVRHTSELQIRVSRLRPNFDLSWQRLDNSINRINASFQHDCERRNVSLKALCARLQSLDVERVLERGFCLVQDEKGYVYTKVNQLTVGQDVSIVFSQGKALANVKQISLKK